jgi:AcrR family transcriptional regulator
MANRAEQKEKTRLAIMQSALALSETRGFTGLSVREVTREAGIAPATFYRHFVDMDDLGLALVDQVGMALRQMMRQARHRVRVKGSVLHTSVTTFMEFLDSSPQLFRMLSGDRSGGPREFRDALHKEKQRFIDELIDDMRNDSAARNIKLAYIPELADMIVNQVFNGGVDALDMQISERKKLAERLVIQLKMMFHGSYVVAKELEESKNKLEK